MNLVRKGTKERDGISKKQIKNGRVSKIKQ